jgi:hypothetical protein
MMMLYFVGMLHEDSGTVGARDISSRLWIASASLQGYEIMKEWGGD